MRVLKRLKRVRPGQRTPLVYIGILWILAYVVFVANLLRHGW